MTFKLFKIKYLKVNMKNRILLISIAVLALLIGSAQFVSKDNILYQLKFNKSQSTLNEELSNFAVPDISSIDKIFLSDKENNQVTLVKEGQSWRVNNKYFARKDAVDNIMQAIGRLRVKRPISKSEHNVQVKKLATSSTKIEIYQNGELTKTYYIGEATQDQFGTFAIIEGSSVPFVVQIPGFLGFLTPRYITFEELWRENYVFKAAPNEITYVQVLNFERPELGFTLIKDENHQYHLQDYNNITLSNIDTLQIKRYLSHFKKISYEALITHMTDEKRDSLVKSNPFLTITLKAGENNVQVVNTYRVLNDTHYDDEGEMLKYDPDRMYGSFNNSIDLATIQFRTFDKITVRPEFFIKQ